MNLDSLIERLPDERNASLRIILDDFYARIRESKDEDQYNLYFEYYALICSTLDNANEAAVRIAMDIGYDSQNYPIPSDIDFSDSESYQVQIIAKFIRALDHQNKNIIGKKRLEASIQNNKMKMGKIFSYHFNDNEVECIQKIINALRNEITSKSVFENEHKDRILNRLEALQRELHKKMSDLDKFWGLIGDAGVALGKFGDDAKPFVELIHDLTRAVWGAQSRAESIEPTSGLPLLSDKRGGA